MSVASRRTLSVLAKVLRRISSSTSSSGSSAWIASVISREAVGIHSGSDSKRANSSRSRSLSALLGFDLEGIALVLVSADMGAAYASPISVRLSATVTQAVRGWQCGPWPGTPGERSLATAKPTEQERSEMSNVTYVH
jgi:hypothetical protein